MCERSFREGEKIGHYADLLLKDRITELRVVRDQARADTEEAEGKIETTGANHSANQSRSCQDRPEADARPRAAAAVAIIFALGPRVEVDAQKRRVLACPVLYRSRAPFKTKIPTPMYLSLQYNSIYFKGAGLAPTLLRKHSSLDWSGHFE